jgi:hypothetical protein
MKRKIIKWSIRSLAVVVLLLGFLVVIVLTPSLLYANKTVMANCTVYHNKPFDKALKLRIDDATEILKTSELYDPSIKFDICMNDGSIYPSLLQMFLGQAFALGFTSNKVALCGNVNITENYVEVNGHKWNLTQLLAHEETHGLVYHKVGFWNSNPVANHPKWKWEGYPEYVSRQTAELKDLPKNIEQLKAATEKDKDEWGIILADSTVSPRAYFNYRLLIQYCLDVKKMSYENLLKDITSEELIRQQMMEWYDKNR